METLAQEFKVHHYAVFDLVDNEAAEQLVLDTLDDDVSQLIVRLEAFTSREPTAVSSVGKVALKRLRHLARGLTTISDSINALSDEDDNTCLLLEQQNRLSDIKKELSSLHQESLSSGEDTTEFDGT